MIHPPSGRLPHWLTAGRYRGLPPRLLQEVVVVLVILAVYALIFLLVHGTEYNPWHMGG